MKTTTHTIDATGRTLGRVATEAAKALMGKTRADYTPHILSDVKVIITNASKIPMRERKARVKEYQNYSGYPSGQRRETYANLTTRKGHGAALKLAITRMLPKNTFRVPRLKNLTISE